MSNVFRGTGITYFQIPQSCMAARIRRSITKNALWLYIYLLNKSQQKSSLKLTLTGKEIESEALIKDCTIGDARGCLESLGLIRARKTHSGYLYELCDPDCGKPVIGPNTASSKIDFNKLSASDAAAYFKYRLPYAGLTKDDNGLIGVCPFHESHRPKFSVSLTDKAWNCHGCNRHGKLVHLEMQLAELTGPPISGAEAYVRVCEALRYLGVIDATTGTPEAVYPYRDSSGYVVFEVRRYPGKIFTTVKFDKEGEPTGAKTMPALLYNLPRVAEADVVLVVEGEKDADRVQKLPLYDEETNLVAVTTNAHGAMKWKEQHSIQLRGKRVILIGDNDESRKGELHMDSVENSLKGYAKSIFRVHLPPQFKDVSEFLDANGIDELTKMFPTDLISSAIEF